MSPASVTFSSFSQTIPVKPVAPTVEKKPLSKTNVCAGLGLACLAAGGVYIATGRTQNVGKVFEKVKNADSILDVLKNTKLSKGKFKELLFKITGEEEVSEKFIKEVTANPRKSKENAGILKKKNRRCGRIIRLDDSTKRISGSLL